MIAATPPASLPALVYAARYYDPRPKVRTYSHLYLWRVGQKEHGQILMTGAFDDTEPQAAPDGETVFFIRTRDKQPPTVCAFDVLTRKVRVLYSTASPSDLLKNLQVSPGGGGLLVYRTVYTKPYPKVQYKQWLSLATSRGQKTLVKEVWRGVNRPAPETDVDAAWAAGNERLYLVPPHTESAERDAQNESLLTVITNSAAPGGMLQRILSLDATYSNLRRDVSPNRAWIIGQASWSKEKPNGTKFATLVHIDDNEEAYYAFPAAPDETMYWLSDHRLVGIEQDKNGMPTRLHFFTFPEDAPKASATGTISPKPPLQTVDLYLATNAKVIAALKAEGEIDFSNLYQVDTIPKTNDGFILGTPWHRSDRGLRFWIDAKTGNATLWSKCGPPHPSPSGAYFWEQPGSGFATIGKRKNRTPITEPILGLNVASYANPARLIPVVSGAAWTNGADWLPVTAAKPVQQTAKEIPHARK